MPFLHLVQLQPLIVGGAPSFVGYGNSDLSHFGAFNLNPHAPGGMILDPNQMMRPRAPFGAGSDFNSDMVPPGSRFNPIMPPGRPGPRRPDPDHAMPPGFESMYD